LFETGGARREIADIDRESKHFGLAGTIAVIETKKIPHVERVEKNPLVESTRCCTLPGMYPKE